MIIGIIESFIRSIVLCIVKPSIRYCLRKVDGDDNMIVTSQPQAGDEVVPRRQIESKTVFLLSFLYLKVLHRNCILAGRESESKWPSELEKERARVSHKRRNTVFFCRKNVLSVLRAEKMKKLRSKPTPQFIQPCTLEDKK